MYFVLVRTSAVCPSGIIIQTRGAAHGLPLSDVQPVAACHLFILACTCKTEATRILVPIVFLPTSKASVNRCTGAEKQAAGPLFLDSPKDQRCLPRQRTPPTPCRLQAKHDLEAGFVLFHPGQSQRQRHAGFVLLLTWTLFLPPLAPPRPPLAPLFTPSVRLCSTSPTSADRREDHMRRLLHLALKPLYNLSAPSGLPLRAPHTARHGYKRCA